MSEVVLKADIRSGRGKGYNSGLRQKGLLPGVIYGKGIEGTAIQIDSKELERILSSETGHNTIININLNASRKKNTVMIRDIQRDPVKGTVTHVDFYHISLKDRVHTTTPVILVGESEGVRKGGIVQQGIRELEIECLPTEIPEAIELDFSQLEIGQNLTVADVKPPEDVDIVTDPSLVVVSILAPKFAEEPAADKAEEPKEERELVTV